MRCVSAINGQNCVMRRCLLLFVSLLWATVLIQCFAEEVEYYPITWADVTADPIEIPKDEDIGPCICDLTFSKCDANCCCDKDCTEADIALFTECLPEGPKPRDITYCADVGAVGVNQISDVDILNEQLCVKKENNPLKGIYYRPKSLNAIDFSCSSQDSTFEKCAESISSDDAYEAASPVLAKYENLATNAPVMIPTQSSGIGCKGGRIIEYLIDVSDNECSFLITDINSTCSTLSVTRYLKASPLQGPSSTKSVTIMRTFKCYDENGISKKCTLDSSGFPSSYASSAPEMCLQAVKKVVFVFTYGDGLLSALSIIAELVDLPSAKGDSFFFPVDFQVQFVQPSIVTTLTPVRPKSGNPGYITGNPVLSGFLTESDKKQAILQPVNVNNGLTIITNGDDGLCDEQNRTSVLFGENTITGCALLLSASDLSSESGCTETRLKTEALLKYPNATTSIYVGQFGDADYSNIEDWIQVKVQQQTGNSGVCGGLVVAAHFRFTVARYGAWDNPQQRIVQASVTYVMGSLSPVCLTIECLEDPQTYKSRYYLQSTVTFTRVEDKRHEAIYKPPPTLPTLPDDVFYPFNLGSASPASQLVVSPVTLLMPILLYIANLAF